MKWIKKFFRSTFAHFSKHIAATTLLCWDIYNVYSTSETCQDVATVDATLTAEDEEECASKSDRISVCGEFFQLSDAGCQCTLWNATSGCNGTPMDANAGPITVYKFDSLGTHQSLCRFHSRGCQLKGHAISRKCCTNHIENDGAQYREKSGGNSKNSKSVVQRKISKKK